MWIQILSWYNLKAFQIKVMKAASHRFNFFGTQKNSVHKIENSMFQRYGDSRWTKMSDSCNSEDLKFWSLKMHEMIVFFMT